MANTYYDRYESFNIDGNIIPIPGIYLQPSPTDKMIVYHLGKTRLDRISNTYYGNPWHGFLILAANPQYGGLEFNIPDNTIIRIPFPFTQALQQYQANVNNNIVLYGMS